ncbi:MAG TPA: peptidoglycan-binding protein [Blastocatellia bacterium]|nr:peptidoglycan-binding protein [Blastocatellia bacterium]
MKLAIGGTAAVLAILIPGSPSYAQTARRTRQSAAQYGQGLVVPEGTVLNVRMDSTVNSRISHVGDKFTGTVTEPVVVDGEIAIPDGSVVEGEITGVTPAKRMSKSGTISVDFDALVLPNGARVQLAGSLTAADPADRQRIDEEGTISGGGSGKRTAVFVGGGGAVGAVLGGITGGGTGALEGGAIGAGIGVAGVLLSKGEEAEVRAGTPFGVRLDRPLAVGEAAGEAPSDEGNSTGGAAAPPGSGPERDYPPPGASRPDRDYPPPGYEPPRGDRPDSGDSQPAGSGDGSRVDRPDVTRTGPARPQPSGADPPLASPEMVRRAQGALQDQGYYEGNINGSMDARTSNALRTYQHDHNLPETGDLDPGTARSLGIVGPRGAAAGGDRTRDPRDAGYHPNSDPGYSPGGGGRGARSDGNSPNSSGYPDSDSSIAYPRSSGRRGGYSDNRGAAPGDQTQGGYDNGRPPRDSGAPARGSSYPGGAPAGGRVGPIDPALAYSIRRQADDILASYEQLIGVQTTGRGVELERSRYGEPEIALLFAFNSFANAARLYAELSSSVDQASRRPVVLALAREARRTDRVFTTAGNTAAQSLTGKWDAIRQDVLRLMDSENIGSADIEEK